VAYLSCLPNMTVMAASDEAELMHMVATAAAHDSGPIAFRYPRGEGVGVELPERGEVLPIGKGRIVREGKDAAILCLGTRLHAALAAADHLQAQGVSCTVADARFAKPLDVELIRRLARTHRMLVTVEDASIGGFGSHVLDYVVNNDLLRPGLVLCTLTLPDVFQDHDDPQRQYETAGLNAAGIAKVIEQALRRSA
jgi:1-deoxy-D-xylulose-5-phosphate synthase